MRSIGVWQLCVIVAFLVLSGIQASKPLHLDDASLPPWAKAAADTGKPIAYRGEDYPHDPFVYHTPLYLYVLAAWIKLFGYGPAQLRLFGAVCSLLFGVICLQFIDLLFGPDLTKEAGLYFWPFFLLNAYTFQTAAIIDIDNTIYGPLLCGFALSLVALLWRGGQPRKQPITTVQLALPAVLLCLGFWAKLTTVLIFVPVPFFIFLFRFGWRQAFRIWLTVSAMGVGLFLLTFLPWCSWMGVGYTAHLEYLWSFTSTPGPNRLVGYWRDLEYMFPFTLKWTGWTPWLAAAALLVIAIRAVRRRDERAWCLTVLLTTCIAGAIYYCMQRNTFGQAPYKYHFVFWGPICLALPLLIATRGRPFEWMPEAQPIRPRSYSWAIAVFAAALLTGLVLVQDSGMRAQGADTWRYVAIWCAPPLAAALVIALLRSPRVVFATLVTLLVVTVGVQSGICIFQVRQSYSTTYNYGQTGMKEAADYVTAVTQPSDLLFAMKDFSELCHRRYYENYHYLYYGPEWTARTKDVLEKTKFAIFTEGLGEDQLYMNPEIQSLVASHCTLVRSIGNYRIYAVHK